MYTLYHQDGTRSTAALLALEEGGLEYEVRQVDISSGRHRDAEFLALNPRGLIPVLITETGEVIGETAAIMLYLADRHRLTDLAPFPEEPGRGALHDWLFYHVGEVQATSKIVRYAHRYSTDPDDVPRIRTQMNRALVERWKIVDRHLAEHGPYHLGERFSLVDLYLATTAVWFTPGLHTLGLDSLPAVKRCCELVASRPRSGPVLARHTQGMSELNSHGFPD